MNPRVATVIREMQEHCRPLNITEDNFYDQCCEPIPQLPFKISCDQGISKGVFLIEGADEVIKVPFQATMTKMPIAKQCLTMKHSKRLLTAAKK